MKPETKTQSEPLGYALLAPITFSFSVSYLVFLDGHRAKRAYRDDLGSQWAAFVAMDA